MDTLATIGEKINRNENIRNLVFFSSDITLLYPILQAKNCAATIARLVQHSSLVEEGVNWDQASLYLARTLTRDRVRELKLQEVILAWRNAGGRRKEDPLTDKNLKEAL